MQTNYHYLSFIDAYRVWINVTSLVPKGTLFIDVYNNLLLVT